MNEFGFYFSEGIHHITDPQGFDHMAFVITLCAYYNLHEIKKYWYSSLLLLLGIR